MGLIIINILGMAGLGHLVADFLNQIEKLPQKPFKCNMCMTFWLSVLPFIFLYGWTGILYSALASIVSEIYFKYI